MSIARARALIIVGVMLLFCLIFAGWAIASTNGSRAEAECLAASVPKELPKTGDVTVNVYNATDRSGLAATVKGQLAGRGFKVGVIGTYNDSTPVTGVGEVHYGPSGIGGALLAQANIVGITPVMDTRENSTVDIVIGPEFKRLATATEMATTVKHLQDNPVTPTCSGIDAG
jgi:hypothetical protein